MDIFKRKALIVEDKRCCDLRESHFENVERKPYHPMRWGHSVVLGGTEA